MSQEQYIIRELTRLTRLVEIAQDQKICDIKTMPGGLTNHNYKIILEDGFTIAARVPGEGTEEYIDRAAEKYNLTLMGTLGIAPQIYYYNTKTGAQLTEFIHAATMHPEDFQRDRVLLARAAMLMKTYHESGLKQAGSFSPTDKIRSYGHILNDSGFVCDFPHEERLRQQLHLAEEALVAAPFPKVPCHNDPLSENFMYDGDKLTMIDWEFAGMNDCFFDLAAFIVENRLDDETVDAFLTCYCGHEPTEKERARLLLNRFLLDSFVFFWSLMQLNAGKDPGVYRPYAEERLFRALSYTEDPFFTQALDIVRANDDDTK